MAIPVPSKITPEEYLAQERQAQFKSEYWHGEVFSMAGGRANHNILGPRLAIVAGTRLRGRKCTIFSSDMKVGTSKKQGFAYPDLTIVRGQPKYFDEVTDVLTNPTVIFEVLSESTRDFDMGQKFREYRTLNSLQHYVLVEQSFRSIDHYRRTPEGWLLETLTGESAVLRLAAIDIELPLTEVYEGLDVPDHAPDDAA